MLVFIECLWCDWPFPRNRNHEQDKLYWFSITDFHQKQINKKLIVVNLFLMKICDRNVVWRYPLMSSGSRVQWPWPESQMESIVLPAAARRGSGARAVWWWRWPRAGLHAANTPTGSIVFSTTRNINIICLFRGFDFEEKVNHITNICHNVSRTSIEQYSTGTYLSR